MRLASSPLLKISKCQSQRKNPLVPKFRRFPIKNRRNQRKESDRGNQSRGKNSRIKKKIALSSPSMAQPSINRRPPILVNYCLIIPAIEVQSEQITAYSMNPKQLKDKKIAIIDEKS